MTPFPCVANALDKAVDILIVMAGFAHLFRLYANLRVSQNRLQAHRQRGAAEPTDDGGEQTPIGSVNATGQAAGKDADPTPIDAPIASASVNVIGPAAAGEYADPRLTDLQDSNVENPPGQAELADLVSKWSKLARTTYISRGFIFVFIVETIIFLPLLFAVDTCDNIASDDAVHVLEYFVLLNFCTFFGAFCVTLSPRLSQHLSM